MNITRLGALALAATAGLTVTGCTDYYDGYGYGYSRPYYSTSYRYPSSYYNGSTAYGYGTPYYYGWYDNFYYPGVGTYLYDRGGTRYRWNDSQRQYWESRRGSYRGRENWSGYRNNGGTRDGTRQWDGNNRRRR